MSDKNISPRPQIKPGYYRHYKGNMYEVIDLACHSETLEWYVVYRPLYEHTGMPDTWVRPAEMFAGSVAIEGKMVRRFTFIDKQS